MDEMKLSLLQSSETQKHSIFRFPRMFRDVFEMLSDVLDSPIIERLKRDEHFDLVIFGFFFNDFQLGLAAHFRCPSVIISATPVTQTMRNLIGNPSMPSIVASPLLSANGGMTFTQRVLNHIVVGIEQVIFSAIESFAYEPTYRQHFPVDRYPSFEETKKNVSLILVSSHFSQSDPMPTFPGLIEVSGIQIKAKPDPLPATIQTWLDEALDGAIFFSLGSNIISSQMQPEKLTVLLNVFGRLKQRVLWKWEDAHMPGKPDNVMVGEWLPQDDILAHPNVRLFISHCGKGSMNEAKYHGVPVLGIPMFGDQHRNLNEMVAAGWAVPVDFAEMTESSFERALLEVLQNSSYTQVVKTAADLYKDRPEHPLDKAVFWVEYVLRHNGAKHMQSQAVHLNWIQYHSLDVIGFILVAAYVACRLIKWVAVSGFSMFFRKKTNKAKIL